MSCHRNLSITGCLVCGRPKSPSTSTFSRQHSAKALLTYGCFFLDGFIHLSKKNGNGVAIEISMASFATSLENQGQIAEARGSLNGRKKMATKKSIVLRARRVRPTIILFFVAIFFRLFRLPLACAICPWVSKDALLEFNSAYNEGGAATRRSRLNFLILR